MLKNVCDRCGKVMEGDGNLPDINALDIYLDEEPIVSYIHLCDKCRERICDIVKYNIEGEKRPPRKQKEHVIKNAPLETPKTEEPKAQPEIEVLPAKVESDNEIGRVVKRIPLPKITHVEPSTSLFDDD